MAALCAVAYLVALRVAFSGRPLDRSEAYGEDFAAAYPAGSSAAQVAYNTPGGLFGAYTKPAENPVSSNPTPAMELPGQDGFRATREVGGGYGMTRGGDATMEIQQEGSRIFIKDKNDAVWFDGFMDREPCSQVVGGVTTTGDYKLKLWHVNRKQEERSLKGETPSFDLTGCVDNKCPANAENIDDNCQIAMDVKEGDPILYYKSGRSMNAMSEAWQNDARGGEITHGRHLSILHNTVGIDPRFKDYRAADLERACEIDKSRGGHQVIKQLRECTLVLEAFSAAARQGHQHSTEANRAYVEQFKRVIGLLNKLGGDDTIHRMNEAFTKDQMIAMGFLQKIVTNIQSTLTKLDNKHQQEITYND